MRHRQIAVVTALAFLLAALASLAGVAGTAPKDIVYKGKTKAQVVFRHTTHQKSLKCASCHTKLFKTKKHTTKFTMEDITAGKSCGACHTGKSAFAVKQCAKCHVETAKKPGAGSGCPGECKDCNKCGP